MDGTHNTTMYENLTLFTLLVRNNWGHGMLHFHFRLYFKQFI